MKTVLAALILMLPQMVNTGHHRAASTTAPCVLPTFTNSYYMYNSGILCGGGAGSPCSNGNAANTVPDGSDGGSLITSGSPPTYTTGVVNSLPGLLFNGNTGQLSMAFSPDYAPSGQLNMYAVIQLGTLATLNPMVGHSAQINTQHAYTWIIDTSGKQGTYASQSTNIGTGTHTFTSGSPIAVSAKYNFTTGVWSFTRYSGGTATADGSGLQIVATWNSNTDSIGIDGPDLNFYTGYILEIDADTTGASLDSAFATYVNCKYAI